MNNLIKINLYSEQITKSLAELISNFAKQFDNRLVIYLSGNLGAGKTTFSQYFIKAFDYKDYIKSPTYTLVEHYEFNDKNIYHCDLYRLASPDELSFLGFEELLCQDNNIFLIEWPEKGTGYLPPADIDITLELDEDKRTAVLTLLIPSKNNKLIDLWQKLENL